jgi:hypothetical protein
MAHALETIIILYSILKRLDIQCVFAYLMTLLLVSKLTFRSRKVFLIEPINNYN